jgi:hypothetical protein
MVWRSGCIYPRFLDSALVGGAPGRPLDRRVGGPRSRSRLYGAVQILDPTGTRTFIHPYLPKGLWGPPNLLSNGLPGAPSPDVKRQGREADHSPPTGAEVKNAWICTSISLTSSWRSAELIKNRDNCTFALTTLLSMSPVAVFIFQIQVCPLVEQWTEHMSFSGYVCQTRLWVEERC